MQRIFRCVMTILWILFRFYNVFTVKMNIAAENVEVEVPHGTSRLAGSENVNRFVETDYQRKLLTEIIQTFAVGEVCLVGKELMIF